MISNDIVHIHVTCYDLEKRIYFKADIFCEVQPLSTVLIAWMFMLQGHYDIAKFIQREFDKSVEVPLGKYVSTPKITIIALGHPLHKA